MSLAAGWRSRQRRATSRRAKQPHAAGLRGRAHVDTVAHHRRDMPGVPDGPEVVALDAVGLRRVPGQVTDHPTGSLQPGGAEPFVPPVLEESPAIGVAPCFSTVVDRLIGAPVSAWWTVVLRVWVAVRSFDGWATTPAQPTPLSGAPSRRPASRPRRARDAAAQPTRQTLGPATTRSRARPPSGSQASFRATAPDCSHRSENSEDDRQDECRYANAQLRPIDIQVS